MTVIESDNCNHYLSWGEFAVKDKLTTTAKMTAVATVAFQTLALTLATSSTTFYLVATFTLIATPYVAIIALIVAAATIALCLKRQLIKPVEIERNEICSPEDFDEINKILQNNTQKTLKADLIVYNSGHESWQMKKEMIRSASQSIECTFNFAGGKILREFLSICEERMKAQPDLKIHLMLEDICSEKEDLEFLKRLQEENTGRFFYLVAEKQASPISLVGTEENHAKLLIVDGKYFMIGSSGTHPTYCDAPLDAKTDPTEYQAMVPAARHDDTDVAGEAKEDRIAFLMRYEFFRLYTIWRKRLSRNAKEGEGCYFKVDPDRARCANFTDNSRIHKDAQVNFLVSGPEHRGHNPIDMAYVKMIEAAEKKIEIANLAFYLTQTLREALMKTHATKIGYFEGGGKGKYTMSHFSKSAIHTQNRLDLPLIDKRYNWIHPLSLFHRKVMVCDGKNSIVGSYNLGIKSAQYDYECALKIVDNPNVAGSLQGFFTENTDLWEEDKIEEGAIAKVTSIASIVYRNLVSPIMG